VSDDEDVTLHPTHNCFDDVIDYINMLAKGGMHPEEIDRRYTIVHGIMLLPDGKPVSHAWLEQGGVVTFAGLYKGERVYVSADRAEYVRYAMVYDETRYTVRETCELQRRTGWMGPWKPEYRALCGDVQRGETPL
jgi:hypothetical protein